MSTCFVLLNATVLKERRFGSFEDALAGVNAAVRDNDNWSIGESARDDGCGRRIRFGRGPII